MQSSVRSIDKIIFILLLYISGFSGFITDLFMGSNKTALYVLYDGLIFLLALTSLSYIRSGLASILLFIAACVILNFSYNESSVISTLNGLREVIIFPCLIIFYNKIFAEGNEETAKEYIGILKKYASWFLIAQIPVAYLQFVQYGPSDYVGGTLGGGGSGVLTLSVICLVYFMSHFRKNLLGIGLLYFCLTPLMLNETKVSFILIPLMFVFIYFEFKLSSILWSIGGAIVFLFLFNTLYTHKDLDFGESSMSGIFSADFLDEYLMGDIYSSDDIPRFTKIIIAWKLISEQVNTLFFGLEYGVFKGGSVLGLSHFAQTYQWLLGGTRPFLFILLIQGGLAFTIGIFWLIAYANNYFRHTNKFAMFLLLIFTVMLFYNDAFRNQNFCAVYFLLVYYVNSPLYRTENLETS